MGSPASSDCLGRLAANRRLRLSVQYASILVLSLLWFAAPQSLRAVSTTVVISEFRVRGPNGGSDEFVELYNLASSPVDISGWKLKGSNNAGTVSVRATVPSGKIIPAHGHYLFTNSSTSGGPYSGSVAGDETYATGITDDGGIAITLPDDTIVDQAGLSSGSAYKEGTPLASLGTSNLDRSYERKPGGAAGSGQDSDNNSADFQLIAPSDPQNTSSAPSGSPTNPTGSGSANPSTVAAGGTTLLTVQVTPGQNPTSSGIAVGADLSSIGGLANQPLFDDGSNGDVTAADRVFSFQATVRMGTTPGAKTIPAAITDAQARTGSTGISLTIQSDSIAPGAVVISQIYGGGGNSGAVFKNDFIEIFNRSSAAVNVSGWSVQYASATGTSWQKTDLSGTIPPGRYLLIQEASGSEAPSTSRPMWSGPFRWLRAPERWRSYRVPSLSPQVVPQVRPSSISPGMVRTRTVLKEPDRLRLPAIQRPLCAETAAASTLTTTRPIFSPARRTPETRAPHSIAVFCLRYPR